jgi:aspartate-alanine antiporter
MIIESILNFLKSNEIFSMFLALALGYFIGKVKLGKFQLGGIAGSLLVAVFIGQLGFNISGPVKTLFFGLFVYACGYKGGPSFFGALNRKSLKFVVSAIIMTVSGLVCVLIAAKLFDLDRGLAAGLAAGGLTQSAIIGTAGDSISKLGLAADVTKQLTTNVAVGYSVTYIFGSLGPILMCGTIIPMFMKWNLKKSASDLELEQSGGALVLKQDEVLATKRANARAFKVSAGSPCIGKSPEDIELLSGQRLLVLDIIRNKEKLDLNKLDEYIFQENDIVVLGGLVTSLIEISDKMGTEIFEGNENQVTVAHEKSIIITNKEFDGVTLGKIGHFKDKTRGLMVISVFRGEKSLEINSDTSLKLGDEITLAGRGNELVEAVKKLGYISPDKSIVNYITMSVGMFLGVFVGSLSLPILGIPVSLGTGGGCLLTGLIFGWLRSKHPKIGGVDIGTVNFLQSFGLAVFVVIVGLNAGQGAIVAVKQYGMTLFWLGVFVTLVPQIFTFAVSYLILGIKNPVEAVSIVAGGRSANPALSELLGKTENSTPILPFTIGYAVANILLTMWGPIIVAIVTKNV